MTRQKQIGLRPMRSWAMISAWGYDAPGCDLSPLRLEQGKHTGTRIGRSTGGKAWRFDAFAGQKVLPADSAPEPLTAKLEKNTLIL